MDVSEVSGEDPEDAGLDLLPDDLVADQKYTNDGEDETCNMFEGDLFDVPNESESEIGEEEGNEVDYSQVLNDKYWLVKVPRFLYDAWTSNVDHKNEVGVITFSLEDLKKQKNKKINLTIPKADWSESLPREYKCMVTKPHVTNELVFAENLTTGESEGLRGNIEMETSIMPVIGTEYRRIMQDRCRSVYMGRKQIEVLNESKDLGQTIAPKKADSVDQWFGLFMKKKFQSEKKERVGRADLINIIFAAFEQYSNWSFKGLSERTKQPQSWLKEVLDEVCILKKRGPYVGTYELKPEYKYRFNMAKEASSAESSSATNPETSTECQK